MTRIFATIAWTLVELIHLSLMFPAAMLNFALLWFSFMLVYVPRAWDSQFDEAVP